MIVYDSTVNERYALALFNVVKKLNVVDQVKTEAEQLLAIKEKNHKFIIFLEGPQFSTESKRALFDKAFGGKVHPVILQLFKLLFDKDRIYYARPILRRFIELADADQGIHPAEVTTAIELSADAKSKLQSALENYTKNRLHLKFRTEPALIGGIRFTMGDLMIDDSVKGKLDRLKYQLQEATRA